MSLKRKSKHATLKKGKFQLTLWRRQTNLYLEYRNEKASYIRPMDFEQVKNWLFENCKNRETARKKLDNISGEISGYMNSILSETK